MIDPLEAYAVARRVGDVLDGLGIRWAVVGSLASSVHGVPRSTQDVDLVATVDVFDAERLAALLRPLGYVDMDAVLRAAERGRSFNFIDDATCDKVDVFCVAEDAEQIGRARAVDVGGIVLPCASAEDTVVHKLRWFDRGGRVSERQWRDVVEVLQVQGDALDVALLERLAAELHVTDLLDAARRQAKGPDPGDVG